MLPIVLYNGDAKWTAVTDIAALIPKAELKVLAGRQAMGKVISHM